MKNKIKLLLLFLFCIGIGNGFAQNRNIVGSVTDENGEPVVGVSVAVRGGGGTVTDINGRFTLNAPTSATTLIISYVGMNTQELPIQPNMTVVMKSNDKILDEVVVVGYGTQKKANLTGAVSTVDVPKTLENRSITDVGRALQGSTPGLSITTTSGALGGSPRIRIRGNVSTIGGGTGDPLILVDNVEVPDLSYVNPDDIESISVLKDASTCAIYGARAAFGAVLITTKKGVKDKKPNINYSSIFSWGTPTKVPIHTRADLNLQYSFDQLNGLNTTPTTEFGQVGYYYNEEVIEKVKKWIETYGDGKQLGREMVEGRDFDYRTSGGVYYYRPWDIYNEYYKKWTPQQNHNINVSGGSKNVQYNLSAAFLNQSGVLKLFDDSYKRYNVTGFVSSDIRNWISVRARYMLAKTTEISPFFYAAEVYQPIYYLYRWHQVFPYGTYNGNEFRNAINDLKSAREVEDEQYFNRLTLGTTLTLMKGLTFDFDYAYGQTFNTVHRVGGYVSGIDSWSVNKTKNLDFNTLNGVYTTGTYDYAQYTSSKNIRNTYNGYFTYSNNLKNTHDIKITVGANIEDANYIWLSGKRNGVYDFDKGELNLAGGDQFATSSHSGWSVAGIFGRINYSLLNRYLLEINGRYDGSSRFASEKRWGFFPSMSVAWRVTEEPFMEPLRPVLSSLKLRGSWGSIGNQDVPMGAFLSTLSATTPSVAGNYWLINGNYVPYISGGPTVVNRDLTWETVKTLDFGFDAGFFKNELNITFDWYQRKTLNMLSAGETVPSTIGINAPLINFGELTTNGIEFSVSYNHRFNKDFSISLTGQFTDFVTKVTKFASANDPVNSNTYWEGKTLGDIWGYKVDRLFQKEDFVWDGDKIKQTVLPNGQSKNTLVDGVPNQYILESGKFQFSPGDVKFKDLNGDGVIDYGSNTVGKPGDRNVIGNTTPRNQYGFRLGAVWKYLDIDMFFQGVGKRSLWATGNMILPGYYGAEANFAHTLDYWTPENTGAFYPRPLSYDQTAKWNYLPNDRYLINAAYLRLKSLVFGYSFPKELIKKIALNSARIYFNGENLFEIDNMHGVPLDPEIGWTTATERDSRAFGRSYPYRRTISFGVQIGF